MLKFKKVLLCLLVLTVSTCLLSCGNEQRQEILQNDSTKTPAPQHNATTQIPNTEARENNILGSYSTTILDTEKNRVNNIQIAANEIDGYTLNPDEVFSFNDVLGKRVTAKGYKKARIIKNGKPDWGTGGGICQVSSTLYNAVNESGLEVVERHSHTKDVHYVPMGQDATVVYGSSDFKFKNTKNYPVVIKISVVSNNVYASILKK
ncbi:MAG: VanW family protein [Bacillota bacterium]|nr:VanW family protein [Bacillota bacterium]